MKNGPGHGKKICRNCKETIGAATKVCPYCELEATKPKPTIMVDGKAVEINPNVRRFYTLPDGFYTEHTSLQAITSNPAGIAPVRLRHQEDHTFPNSDSILDWCMAVREKMLEKGFYITNKGLYRWAAQEVNRSSPVEQIPGGFWSFKTNNRYDCDDAIMVAMKNLIEALPDIQFRTEGEDQETEIEVESEPEPEQIEVSTPAPIFDDVDDDEE